MSKASRLANGSGLPARRDRRFSAQINVPYLDIGLTRSEVVEAALHDDGPLPSVAPADHGTANATLGDIGGADVEAEGKGARIFDIFGRRHGRVDMQYRDVGFRPGRRAGKDADRMAAPLQFFQQVEEHVRAVAAQQQPTPALKPVELMRDDRDACHMPLGFQTAIK